MHYFANASPAPLSQPFALYIIVVGIEAVTLLIFGATFSLALSRSARAVQQGAAADVAHRDSIDPP